MYCEFYGFSEKPFEVTPDPQFLYLTANHQEILAALVYGINERRGFITIVGEVGTGKTTLLKAALDRLNQNTKTAFIFNTDLSFENILTMALFDLGLARLEDDLPKTETIHRLNQFANKQLSGGGNVALIIDEGQNLNYRSLEKLRLLSNLETSKHKLVQIVLSGQPELDTNLRKPGLRQLAQRISLKRYVTPLSKSDTYEYIQHRLSVVKFKGQSLFSNRAKDLIWQYTGGIPRKINVLCDNALLIGYGLGNKQLTDTIIKEAIKDLTWSPFRKSPSDKDITHVSLSPGKLRKGRSRLKFALAFGLILVLCLATAGWLLVGDSKLQLLERAYSKHKHIIERIYTSLPDPFENKSDKTPPVSGAAAQMKLETGSADAMKRKPQTDRQPVIKIIQDPKLSIQEVTTAKDANTKGKQLQTEPLKSDFQ
jgi:type II secretory pathway predicted ATPase ExeA